MIRPAPIILSRLIELRGAGSWADVASQIGVSPQFLSMVVNGRKNPSEKLCAAIGVKRVVTVSYERDGDA